MRPGDELARRHQLRRNLLGAVFANGTDVHPDRHRRRRLDASAGWTGGGCSGTGTCTVTMSAADAVTATFALEQRHR